jgi:hypothetical protein
VTEQLAGSLRDLLANPPEEVLAEIARDRSELRSGISGDTLHWMALAPVWTVALAQRCGLPTESGQDVRSAFELLVARGLCEYGPDPDSVPGADPSPGDRYWMTPTARRDVLAGSAPPGKTLSDIGTAVLEAVSGGVPTVPALERWATLAAAREPEAIAEVFTRTIEQLLADARSGEALRWIEAARPIAELVTGEMTAAVARAGGRVELFHRRSFDLERLESFIERREQIDAFDDLLEGIDGAWALHYFGDGGVGKTTLLRFITAKLIGDDASYARVDFDYLNPDYPGRAPGLLLVHLAEELRLHAGTEAAARLFSRFDGKVTRVHELISAGSGALSGLAAIANPEFQSLIESFAEAASRLPQPILILFDTCEELAKLRPDGRVGANVEATFSIIDSLRRLLAEVGGDLRVVFSGRRMLASAGANFEGGPSALPVRDYLRLHEIRGFERGQAEEFLEREGVRPELHAAILQRSLVPTESDRVRWKHAEDRPERVERHSPFDLALYARWASEDSKLDAADVLAATTDRYIEMRIVRRIHHEGLRALLPTVALLGRLDRDTLRAATDVPPSAFGAIRDELSRQEWIDSKPGEFLEVDRGLAPRLRAYFLAQEPHALDAARRRVADHLCEVALTTDLSSLDVSHLEGAFWALAPNPERAGAWWRDVEARFARETAWEWALGPLRLLLGDEGVAPPRDSPSAQDAPAQRLRPALLATYAAAALHAQPGERREALWQEVLAEADRHPDPAEATRLRVRARAGILVDRVDNGDRLRGRSIAPLWAELGALDEASLDEQLAAACIAGVEAVVEDSERHGKAIDDPRPVLDLAARIDAPPLSAFAATLAARVLVLAGRGDEAQAWFDKGVATTPPGILTRQTWLDWHAPDDIGARVRLELVRAAASGARSPQSLLTVIRGQGGTTLGSDIATILRSTALDVSQAALETERLAGRIVGLVTDVRALRPGEAQDLARIEWPSDAAGPVRRRNVLSASPPFAVQVARALGRAGEVGAALGLLTRVRYESESAADALDRVRAAELAQDEIAARMRLTDFPDTTEPQRVRSDLALTLQGLGVPEPTTPTRQDPHALHAWWRTRYLLRPELVGPALVLFTAAPVDTENLSSFASASLFLDLLEANELAQELQRPLPFPEVTPGQLDVSSWLETHPSDPEEGFRLLLRTTAIDPAPRMPAPNDLAARLGALCAARIALEEGELLALRLPQRSITLLDYARQVCIEHEDFVGALIAEICSATAVARAGRRSQVGPRLRRAKSNLALVPGLPSTAELERLADSPSSEALDGLGPREWRPWLVRLLACLIWDKDAGTPGPRIAAFLEWLGATYGRGPDGEPLLPAELDGWLERDANEDLLDRFAGRVVATREESLRESVARARVLAAQGRGIRAFAPLATSVAAVLLVGGLAFLGFAWVGAPAWVALGAAAVVIAVVVAVTATQRARLGQVPVQVFLSRTILSRRRPAPITVSVSSPTPPVTGAIGRPLQVTVEVRWPPRPAMVAESSVEALRPYAAADPALRALAGRLDEAGGIRSGRLEGVFEVDIASSAVGWEGLFALADPKLRGLRARRVVVGPRRARRQPAKAWTVGTLADGLADRRVAALGLRRSGSSMVPGTRLRDLLREGETKAIHLIGHCVETASGVRFQLSSEARSEIEQSFSEGYGELLHTESIVRALPELRLCILQSAPIEARERTSLEREQAAYLRLLGAELFALGVSWVATIPPLPGELAARTLEHVAKVLRGPVGGRPGPLLDSSARARKEISSWPWTDPAARAETPFDLTVYAADSEGAW